MVAAYRIPSYRRGDGTRYVPTVRTDGTYRPYRQHTVQPGSSPGVEPPSARAPALALPTKPARFSARVDPVFILYRGILYSLCKLWDKVKLLKTYKHEGVNIRGGGGAGDGTCTGTVRGRYVPSTVPADGIYGTYRTVRDGTRQPRLRHRG